MMQRLKEWNGTARRDAVSLVMAAGPLVVAGWCLALVLLAVSGSHPFWPRTPVTLAEAAALQSGWEVVRQLADGVNPDAPQRVRAGILGAGVAELSTWEAAVEANQVAVLELLFNEGFRPGPDVARRIVCRARRRQSTELLAVLSAAELDVRRPCSTDLLRSLTR